MLELLLTLIATLTGIDRQIDPGLQAFAQERSAEITCEGCFNHDGKEPGVAEILTWHVGGGDLEPARAVNAWLASPPHAAILLDPRYTRIGCGYTYSAETNGHYFACELAVGDPAPNPTPVPEAKPVPNTAISPDGRWLAAIGLLLVVAASAVRPRPGRKED